MSLRLGFHTERLYGVGLPLGCALLVLPIENEQEMNSLPLFVVALHVESD